jgi:hypothetical protein
MEQQIEGVGVGAYENEKDESDILGNQDETDPGTVNEDDNIMGAGPTDALSADEPGEFVRGEVDVKEQMDRASRAADFPNRAAHVITRP